MRFLLIKPYQGLMILQFTKNIKEKTFFEQIGGKLWVNYAKKKISNI